MHIDLTQGVIKGHIIKLALPAIIGYSFHTLINVTDTFFAGMISTQALAVPRHRKTLDNYAYQYI